MIIEKAIATVIGYLAKSITNSKGANTAKDEISEATWNWIRPLFIKDEQKEILEKFESKPEENSAKMTELIKSLLVNDSSQEANLQRLFERIETSSTVSKTINQYGEKSVNVDRNDGTININ